MSMSMSHLVRQRLREDHERLEGHLEAFVAALEGDDPESVARTRARFDTELLAHLSAEEQFLIPALFRTNPREARALLAEHRHIRARLLELDADGDLHIVKAYTARAFIEELRAHARHEDSVLYRWVDEVMGGSDRQSLEELLEASTSLAHRAAGDAR
jgi:hemerythrin superfamily protein